MDNFIDKLAQKFTAGEVIRANQAAEEQELRKLRQQVEEYENCLKEMRKLQLRNTETTEGMKQLLEESRAGLDSLTKESLKKIEQVRAVSSSEKQEEKLTELLKLLEKNQKEIEEWFKKADDFLHKENVKVYRNVQAVITEESKAKTETILVAQENTARKYYKKIMWIMVLTFLAAAAGVVLQVMNLYGAFK